VTCQTQIAGVCVLRNAVDLVPYLCGHYLALGFGHLRFVDDGSSDGSSELLTELTRQSDRISVTRVEEDSFHQPELVTQSANELINAGYSVIIPFDADEFWSLNLDDIEEISILDPETTFCGRWSNFVQDRKAADNSASLLEIKYRAPSFSDANEAAITNFRLPFVCYWEKKIAIKTRFAVAFYRGQHRLKHPLATTLDKEFEIFHIPLRTRSEIDKRGRDYEPRRAALRKSALDSWQSAFHREVILTGRLDEVWAANSASTDGHLDVYGKRLRLIPDDRCQLLLERAASFFQVTFGEWPRATDGLVQRTRPVAPAVPRTYAIRRQSLLQEKTMSDCSGPIDAPRTVFESQGFLGPLPLLTEQQCQLLIRHINRGEDVPPAVWDKGRAITDYLFYDIATQPHLVGLLRLLLGENIILWGASIHSRAPRQIHPWHTDIETSRADMRSVSVWIGIENTTQESSLHLIRGSHRLGFTLQEVMKQRGLRRGEATAQMVEVWAKERDPAARLVNPNMVDGEAIICDGRLWHGTENGTTNRRTAILLQYAASDENISIPDLSQLEWPFRFRAERPPIISVSGVLPHDLHELEKPPLLTRSPPTAHVLHEPEAQFEVDPATGWKPHFIFDGSTCNLEHLTVHVSVLSPGCCPHPPHVHPEEEILLVLDGEAVCVIPDSAEQPDPRTEVLRPGEYVYYPAYQYHTIRNASECPVVYIMMKWRGPIISGPCQWSVPVIRPETFFPMNGENFAVRGLMEFCTSYLTKLHAHQSMLLPGGGYEPHVDEHDVAIIVLSGILETRGRTFGPNAFILHSAGSSHGIRNIGDNIARYLVFEFHASTLVRIDRTRGIHLLEQLTEAQVQSDALNGEKSALEAARLDLLEQLKDAQVQSDALIREKSVLEAARGDLLEQLTAAQAQIDAQIQEKTALETALAAVWTSSSWRITAPLRGISRLLRRSL
jgi:mannose-6-phosphate isomerase-like protein (cupin superfamily)